MLIAQRPILSEEVVDEYRSRFVIEPLEPGFGYTLGNSLRRTLLSSIPGAAVTSIRIDGVLHEFTTVAGVKEDVTDIILNIKSLVVSSDEDEPVTMYVRKQGPGTVTGGDIVAPAGVTVHNPDLHIATLNDKGRLEIELVVERGRIGPAGHRDAKIRGDRAAHRRRRAATAREQAQRHRATKDAHRRSTNAAHDVYFVPNGTEMPNMKRLPVVLKPSLRRVTTSNSTTAFRFGATWM